MPFFKVDHLLRWINTLIIVSHEKLLLQLLMYIHSWFLFLIILSSIMKKFILTIMLKWNVIKRYLAIMICMKYWYSLSNYSFIRISGMFRVNIHANVQYKDNKSILLVWNSFVCVKSFCGLSFGLPIIFHSGNTSN